MIVLWLWLAATSQAVCRVVVRLLPEPRQVRQAALHMQPSFYIILSISRDMTEISPRAMLCIARTTLSQDVRSFVCLSVCLSHAGILSKWLNISSNFYAVGQPHYFSFFPYKTVWQYSDGNPLQRGHRMRGIWKNCDFWPMSRSISSKKWYKIKP